MFPLISFFYLEIYFFFFLRNQDTDFCEKQSILEQCHDSPQTQAPQVSLNKPAFLPLPFTKCWILSPKDLGSNSGLVFTCYKILISKGRINSVPAISQL